MKGKVKNMKCDNCPARSKDSQFTGCLVLRHSIHSYDGCNRTEEKIRSELDNWLKNASESEIERFSFWKSCGIDSHWVPAIELKSERKDEKIINGSMQ